MPGFTVPGFGALTAAHLFGYGGHAALFALLPGAAPKLSPLQLTLPYVAYALPALLLRTIQTPCTRAIPLPFSLFAQAIGFCLIAVAISALRDQLAILLPGSLLCGFGAASAQASTVALVSRAAAGRSRGAGMHLAALEAAASLGGFAGPLAGVALAASDSHSPHNFVPFAAAGILQAMLAISLLFIRTTLEDPVVSDAQRPATITPRSRVPPLFEWLRQEIADVDISAPLRGAMENFRLSFGANMSAEERDTLIGGMRAALRRPWTWLMLSLMLVSAAALSFLRPILAPYVTNVWKLPTIHAALLFSVMALVGALAETITSVTLAPMVPPRALILCGVALSAVGFTVLAESHYNTVAVAAIAAGGSGALVLSVAELASETGLQAETLEDTLGTLATVAFALGEMIGPFAAGLLVEMCGSFGSAVGVWAAFMGVVSVCGWLAYIASAVEKYQWNAGREELAPLIM